MVNYQIQFKKQFKDSASQPALDYEVSDTSKTLEKTWEVVAEHPTLKSATIAAKTLIKKYGYDRVRICRATKMKINIELES